MSPKAQAAPAAPQTDPDADLFARSRAVRTDGGELWAMLVKRDPDLEPLPKRREAIIVDRSTVQGASSRVGVAEGPFRDALAREAENARYLATLEGIDQRLRALRAPGGGADTRYFGARVRDALRMVADGPDASWGNVMPQELMTEFIAAGEPRGFNGRGGLKATRARAEYLALATAHAREEFKARITWAEDAVASVRRFWASTD